MKTLLPFLLLVLVHHFLLVPLIRKRLYIYIILTVGVLVLFGIWCFSHSDNHPDGPPPPPQWHYELAPPPLAPPGGGDGPAPEDGHRPLKPEMMKLIIGALLVGADLGVYFYSESRRKERRMKELQAENQEMKAALSVKEADPVLHFKADHRTISIDIPRIVYVESMSEYIKIFLSDTEDPVIVLYSLKRLIEQLPGDRFMRIHRSYIISLKHISEASHTSVRLDNGVSLPVGESYRQAFAKYLSSR